MSIPMQKDEPSPEEVIELIGRLKMQDTLRRRYIVSVTSAILGGLALCPVVPPLGLSVFFGGVIGAVLLTRPRGLIRIAKRLEKSSDPYVIPPLLDALGTAMKISNNSIVIAQLRQALTVLLRRLSTEDSAVLSESNWSVLRLNLSLQWTIHFSIAPVELEFTLAILDLVKRRRDTRCIATIKSISVAFKGDRMADAVKDCLAVLEEQKRKEDESSVLLRASEPKSTSDILLRPAAYGSEVQAQELLRADNSQHS